MNATTLAELRLTAATGQADQKMDQVRELLFGEYRRQMDQRLADMEARSAAFERDVKDRLTAIESSIEALASSTAGDSRARLESLSRAVSDLGERIGAIAKS